MLTVKLTKLDQKAIIPTRANNNDAGLDLTAISEQFDIVNHYMEYGTGLALEIPEGYMGLIFPRSSLSQKDMMLANAVGVIDSGYRGELKLRFKNTMVPGKKYNIGDKIGQLVILPIPTVSLEVVDQLTDSKRGNGGFGSSDEQSARS